MAKVWEEKSNNIVAVSLKNFIFAA